MALVTLPYPNMDFVPLDVLTANELDQLVANIEAINNAQITSAQLSNNSVTSAKIADSAVSADKIDWASLNAKYSEIETQIEVGTGVTTMNSLALTAGTWLLIGTANFNHANTDTGDCYVGFQNLDTSGAIGRRYYFNERADGTYWSNETCSMATTLTGNTNVAFVAHKAQGTLRAVRYSFVAIRIA